GRLVKEAIGADLLARVKERFDPVGSSRGRSYLPAPLESADGARPKFVKNRAERSAGEGARYGLADECCQPRRRQSAQDGRAGLYDTLSHGRRHERILT